MRAAGLKTDLCDATQVARCRMYRGGRALWDGLAKNADEGLGTATLIVPFTLLLLFGQVLPIVLVGLTMWRWSLAALPAILVNGLDQRIERVSLFARGANRPERVECTNDGVATSLALFLRHGNSTTVLVDVAGP